MEKGKNKQTNNLDIEKAVQKKEVKKSHFYRSNRGNKDGVFYRKDLESVGVVFSGLSPDGELVELIEMKDHPFFMASQFHPEFKSRPGKPHPMFDGFIARLKKGRS